MNETNKPLNMPDPASVEIIFRDESGKVIDRSEFSGIDPHSLHRRLYRPIRVTPKADGVSNDVEPLGVVFFSLDFATIAKK